MSHVVTTDTVYDKLATLITNLSFDEAEKFLSNEVKQESVMRYLHNLAEDTTGILTYTFANYMLQKHENSFWHRAAATLLLDSLDHLLEDKRAALYHLQRAILLDPENWHLKESILNLYNKGLLKAEDAKKYAQEVLKHDSQNRLAKSILA